MRASFSYLGRGSWLARRDPRVLLLVALLFVVAVTQLRDWRHLAVALVIALAYYARANIPWPRIRVQWAYLLGVISLVAVLNALITGGRAGNFADADTHVLLVIPPFGAELSAEGISLAVTQILRFAAIAAVGFPIAYAIAPGDLAVALRRLGIGDRFAFMVDLTVRFIPTIVSEFAETIDAQRVRGYDPTARVGGLLTRLRRARPVLVPVVIGSIAGAEDTIDAMDLRAFGTSRRTWFRRLRFDRTDWAVVIACLAFTVVATWLNVKGQTDHRLLPFLVPG
ncbi:MAG TPA: energy-coupling factor transporter transmembrane component T [candidate division Zixibacteria bacterium]|nr:energy-coupling factor transporter transmembrane component T [candidate division Zixibacteria bacterium]